MDRQPHAAITSARLPFIVRAPAETGQPSQEITGKATILNGAANTGIVSRSYAVYETHGIGRRLKQPMAAPKPKARLANGPLKWLQMLARANDPLINS